MAKEDQIEAKGPGTIWPALLLYNLVFPVLFILYFPFYFLKLRKRGGWKNGFGERFGAYSKEKRQQLQALKNPIWLHAVSVGEVQTALRFIHDWQAENPNRCFILSTTTSTGQKIARKAATDTIVPIYCPLDWQPLVTRALATLRPAMIIIFEVEIWPTIITTAYARRIPIALVNCRLSDRSTEGFSKRKGIFGPLFRRFSIIAAQSNEDAARVARITGDPKSAEVCSTMKYDQVADPGILNGDILKSVLPEGPNKIVVAASTHAGEEIVLARAFCALRTARPDLRMVIVPRHAERAPEVLATLADLPIPFKRLSQLRANNEQAETIIADTTGELMAIMAAAQIVYVGKSMGELRGGQNPIESALLGKATIHGPNMDNFRQVIEDFRAKNATIPVKDEAALIDTLGELLDNDEACTALGERARATVTENRGAIARTIKLLEPLLQP